MVQAQLAADVLSIYSSGYAFAALKHDGSVVAWGHGHPGAVEEQVNHGGDCSEVQEQLATDVQSICSTNLAFAALNGDGSVVAWGVGNGDTNDWGELMGDHGGNCSHVQAQLAADVLLCAPVTCGAIRVAEQHLVSRRVAGEQQTKDRGARHERSTASARRRVLAGEGQGCRWQ